MVLLKNQNLYSLKYYKIKMDLGLLKRIDTN